MNSVPIAAQMYTVRETAAQDLRQALRRVADMGYTGVELAGMFDIPAAELAQALKELGLVCISTHAPLADLRQKLEHIIEDCRTVGATYLVCPWLPPEQRGDGQTYRALGIELNAMGEVCRRHGLHLCYHHHDFELVKFDNSYGLDILLESSDPANLQLEADTYWLKFAGLDPAAYIRRWQGRLPLLHLKDMTRTQPPTFAEVGNGILDWPAIFEAAAEAGVKAWIVEQDRCEGDPFESLKTSLQNLKAKG